MYDDGVRVYMGFDGLYFDVHGGWMIEKKLKRKWILKICLPMVSTCFLSSYQMWHQRLGRPSDQVLRNLVKTDVCHGLPLLLGLTMP